MRHFSTVFNQLLDFVPRYEFKRIIKQFNSDYYVKHFTTWSLLASLMFAQIKRKDSLRDLELGFNLHREKWAHLGLKKVARSTLSDANKRIDYRVFEALFGVIYDQCRDLTPKRKFRFKNPLYALDSSTIDLCLALFEWAKFRRRKGGIKLHCLLNIKEQIPAFAVITEAKSSDVKIAQQNDFGLIPDSIIVFDRGYVDFKLFWAYTKKGIWFVTRAKKNMQYQITGQLPIPRHKKGLLFDKVIVLTGLNQDKQYPETLRLIGYEDPETGRFYQFLTNNFKLAAYTIAQIYKARWEVELFFKWLKQNLEIKTFLGTSKNAVLTQIWIALCYFLLLAYIKYQTKYRNSLLTLSRIISEMLFHRLALIDLLSLTERNFSKIRDGTTAKLPLFMHC